MSTIIKHVGPGTRYYSEQVKKGVTVYYYRRPGFPNIRLHAMPNSSAMDREFYAAEKLTDKRAADKKAGIVIAPAKQRKIRPEFIALHGDVNAPGAEGTLRWLIERFYQSLDFKALAAHSQKCMRINLDRVCAMRTSDGEDVYGDFAVDTIKRKHIMAVQHNLNDKPATADGTAKHLRRVFNWAADEELFDGANPCQRMRWLHVYNDDNPGITMWEPEDIAKFKARHPIGTPARMLFTLMFEAGVRIGDAARLGIFNMKRQGSELHWVEHKGGSSKALSNHAPRPKHRELLVNDHLRKVIVATGIKDGLFARQSNCQPYKPSSVQKAFERFCREAGLTVSAHGVRKAAAARMYCESGGNLAMMCDHFGWKPGSSMAVWYAKRFQTAKMRADWLAKVNALQEAA